MSSRKSVIQDEADATEREGARQAALEKQEVLDAALKAERVAAAEADAPTAKKTFRQKFKELWTGERDGLDQEKY